MHAPGGAGVRRHAGVHKQANKGAGGPEGARARVDMAAQVAISGDRADSGVAGERESTGVTIIFCFYVLRRFGDARDVGTGRHTRIASIASQCRTPFS